MAETQGLVWRVIFALGFTDAVGTDGWLMQDDSNVQWLDCSTRTDMAGEASFAPAAKPTDTMLRPCW